MADLKLPTEVIELPSQGKFYSPDSPLASGKVEIKYMTAKEEDILTNQAYIADGTVLDKLLSSILVTKVDLKELLLGDKDAILIAARILGYGGDYSFVYGGQNYSVDLSTLDNKPLHEDLQNLTENKIPYTVETTGTALTLKLLTHGDEKAIEAEIKALQKINKNASPELSTRLKKVITSVQGESKIEAIYDYVDNYLLAKDSRELRKYLKTITPEVNMSFTTDSGEEAAIPVNLNFFWPDLGPGF